LLSAEPGRGDRPAGIVECVDDDGDDARIGAKAVAGVMPLG
jgi:hypothetical protein